MLKGLFTRWGKQKSKDWKKMEYVTTWSQHRFDDDSREKVDVVLPDDISYSELCALPGLKTKVTIEILPW